MSQGYSARSQYSINLFRIAPLIIAFILGGCGGGNTSAASTADSVTIDSISYSPTAPQSGNPVSVTADVSGYIGNVSGARVSYLWTQASGPRVDLSGTTVATAFFTAPITTSSTKVVLTLTVTLNAVSASRNVSIAIIP